MAIGSGNQRGRMQAYARGQPAQWHSYRVLNARGSSSEVRSHLGEGRSHLGMGARGPTVK